MKGTNSQPLSSQKRLRPNWWQDEFADGTTLRARDEARRQRQLRNLDLSRYDRNRQAEARTYARWLWVQCPANLPMPSMAEH